MYLICHLLKKFDVVLLIKQGPLSVLRCAGRPKVIKYWRECVCECLVFYPVCAVAQQAPKQVSLETKIYLSLPKTGKWVTSVCQRMLGLRSTPEFTLCACKEGTFKTGWCVLQVCTILLRSFIGIWGNLCCKPLQSIWVRLCSWVASWRVSACGPLASWSAQLFPIDRNPGSFERLLKCWIWMGAPHTFSKSLRVNIRGKIGLLSSLTCVWGRWESKLIIYKLSEYKL